MGAGFVINNMGNKSDKLVAAMEFRMKTEQYRLQTLFQMMNDPHNCKCLFRNMEFLKESPTKINLAGASSYNQLGYFTPDCSTVNSPFINSVFGTRGEKVTSVKLTEVEYAQFSYKGNLLVTLETVKSVAGASELSFKIPLALKVRPATDPTKVRVSACSALSENGEPIGSLIKVPYSNDPSENTISLSASSGVLDFPSVPPTASGVFLQYTIGSPSNKRADRNCSISGSNISMVFGHDSKGDGGQRFVAGTAYVPLDGCAADLRYSCNNNGNRGEFRVLAYVDDGRRPTCANSQFTCPTGERPDGAGGCIPDVADANLCQEAYVYDPASDTCIPDSPTCAADEMLVMGRCFNVGPMKDYVNSFRTARAQALAAQTNYNNLQAAAVQAANDAAAADAAAAADPTNTALASAASSANSAATAAASAANSALLDYRSKVIFANTFASAVGPLPVP